ncbi:MAG: RNA polymerase sigma factor [Salibacteraceae bacterium]
MAFVTSRKDSPIADEVLVNRYRQKADQQALAQLFDRYAGSLFGLCLKYLENEAEAKDAVLQLFEKLVKELHRHEVQNFRSWVFQVARNQCLMALREQKSKRKKQERLEAEMQQSPAFGDGIAEAEAREQSLNQLESAMQQLKPPQRECIDLFYLQKKCYTEVAEITGYSLKQVKSYLQNGKRNLRIFMTKNHESYTANNSF